jgi:hypothetical protein
MAILQAFLVNDNIQRLLTIVNIYIEAGIDFGLRFDAPKLHCGPRKKPR